MNNFTIIINKIMPPKINAINPASGVEIKKV